MLEFNYETETVDGLNKESLLDWVSDLHSEMSNNGLLPDSISTETHQQMMILAKKRDLKGD